MKIRRVTTGHNANGKAVFVSDTEVEGHAFAQMPGAPLVNSEELPAVSVP
jgi:hypothetical protein